MDNPEFTSEQSHKKRSQRGNWFAVHLPTILMLIEKGLGARDLIAYLVLAAGTDITNLLTRSGRRAVAAALNCGRIAAGHSIDRLISLGAIQSLEADLDNLRDPTAARFRLIRAERPKDGDEPMTGIGDLGTAFSGPDWARLPNAMVQDPAQAVILSRAVEFGEIAAITTLLRLAADPAQTEWPPEICANVDPEWIGTLGHRSIAAFDLTKDFGKLTFGRSHDSVVVLLENGLVCLDAYVTVEAGPGSIPRLFSAAGTIANGAALFSGDYGEVAVLARLLVKLMENTTDPSQTPDTILEACRRDHRLMALLPSQMPGARLMLRPRLSQIPNDPASAEATKARISAGLGAAHEVRNLIKQHCPQVQLPKKISV